MTISSTANRKSFAGSGTSGPFSFPYPLTAQSDLVVLSVNDATGDSTLFVLNGDYTLTGVTDSVGRYNAGVSIFTTVAVASGTTLIAYSAPEISQELDLVENDPLPAEQIERAIDKLTLITRRLSDRLDRTLHMNDGAASSINTELPTPEGVSAIGWNATGDALTNIPLSTGTSLVDLAASSGANLIGWSQSGIGAVTRTVQDKLRDAPPSVGDYDTVPNAYASGGIFSKTTGAAGNVWLWTRKLSGAISIGADGSLEGFSPSAYMFDTIEDSTVDAAGDFVVAHRLRHRFGGANAKGGRIGFYSAGFLQAATHASNTNRNYVGGQFSFYADDDDGGTDTGAGSLGAVFGGGSAVYLAAAAQNLTHSTAHEFNSFATTGSSVKYQFTVTIAGANAVRGAGYDAALGISGLSGSPVHIGYGVGILFSSANGAEPFTSTSTIIAAVTAGAVTVNRGIDFSTYTITNEIITGAKSFLSESVLGLGDNAGNSIIQLQGPSTNASLLIRSRGTGSVHVQNAAGTITMARFDSTGGVLLPNLPTSSAGVPAGGLWNNAGVVNIV